ncbi:MAG TPA: DUF2294 domain-containing protein [Thermoleophilaceae bacterium]|nr:DUF2294 domain-containing protein [Thermoleophilaceae bacterium]
MAEQDPPPQEEEDGGALLARISNEMVRAQKEFFGKGPTKAKSYMLDDMLIIVMRGGMTTAEKTMLDFGHPDQVRQFRQLFENSMTERLTGKMEELTGRKILTYQSQILFEPDVVVEIFVFDSEGSSDAIEATAEGQLEDSEQGVATDEAALDSPASSGE